MKIIMMFVLLLATPLLAQMSSPSPTWKPTDTKGHAGRIMDQIYGGIKTACTQDSDADTGGANRLGPFTANRKYLIYCHDGSGAGSACECLQGNSSVDASSSVGFVLFAGEKIILTFLPNNLYLSCVPYADNQKIDVCLLDY